MHFKQLLEIGPFKKTMFQVDEPTVLTKEDADKWLARLGEGEIGGIELWINEEEIKIQCLNAKHSLSEQPTESVIMNDIISSFDTQAEIERFQFHLQKPSIYSIIQSESESWLNNVPFIKGIARIQILFQRDKGDKWKTLLKQQNDDYLRGISNPSTFTPFRALQLKLAEISSNITVSTSTIPGLEERLKEPVYRFLIRGFISGEEAIRKSFIAHVFTNLNRQKGENKWGITRKKIQNEQLENWGNLTIPYLSIIHPLITESELAAILPCKAKTSSKTIVQLKKAKKRIENIFPIFQFLPYKQMEDEVFLLDEFEKELNGALEKLGVIKEEGIQIIDCEQGPTLLQLIIKLPRGVRLSDLQKVILDFQTELGITDLGISQGKEKGTGTLILPRKNRQSIYLRSLVDTSEFKRFSTDKILPFVIGTTETGEPLFDDLERVKHLLVAGATGSGKSIWLLQFILTLLIWVPSEQLMMYLIDPKQVEFPGFSKYKNVKVYTEVTEAKQLLKSLIDLMESRYKQLRDKRVRNIAQYNRQAKDNPMPYVVAVIDEFSDFILQDKEDGLVEEYIVRLAQKARACGIHIVITTQRPSVDVVTGLIKANLPSRVVFKCSGRNDYSTVLDVKPPYNLLGHGDGVCLMEGKVLTRFQGPLIAPTEEEMDEVIETYGKNQAGSTPLLTLDIQTESIPKEMASPIYELKRYIAFTGETRITYIRKHMKMRMNDVKELMQLLVEQRWLEAPKNRNSGYKLILTDKERESYLSNQKEVDDKNEQQS